MELKKYTVLFSPLAKAPKGTPAVSYVVEAILSSVAEQLAVASLVADSFKRSWFKTKPTITESAIESEAVVSDDVIALDALAEKEQGSLSVAESPAAENEAPLSVVETPAQTAAEKFAVELVQLNKKVNALVIGELLVLNDLDNELYHAADGVSCSQLKLYIDCPAKYKAKYIDCVIEEVSKNTFDLGTAVHTATLEPHLLAEQLVLQPADIKVRNGKKWDEFKAANAGKLILKQKDHDMVSMANDAVFAHPVAGRLVTGGRAEVSVFKRDELTGMVIKCRPDYMLDDLIVDVKTAASSNPDKFKYDAKKFGYHIQDSMYRDITNSPEFVFLVIENKAPCVVTAPVLMDAGVRRLGYLKYRDALQRLKISLETGVFPGYSDETVIVELTAFEQKELEQLEMQGVA